MSERLYALVLLTVLLPAGVLGADGASPASGWRFAFRDFVIAAWNPPADTEAEYRAYREAGFNLVMSPRYSLPDHALDLAQRHGLRVMIDTYTPNDKPWGGTASAYTPHPTHHPATLPELQWLHARYGTHPALAGYLLGDDYGALPPELVATTRFLHDNAPHLFPWVCQNVMSADSLAGAGNPIQDPQLYPTLYQKGWPAGAQAAELCRLLQTLRRGCLRRGLTPWPMFNVCGVDSDSLVRFQVYASLAFGAEGIWYFTYVDGLQQGLGYETEAEVRGHLLPARQTAAEANRRVAAWGPRLLGTRTVGLAVSGVPVTGCAVPGAGRLIESMDDDLLVGVRLKPGAPPLAVLVDRRVDKQRGAVPEREVELRLAPAVSGVTVLEGTEGRALAGPAVRLKLPGGGGALLELRGDGVEELCRSLETPRGTGAEGRQAGPGGLLLSLSFEEEAGELARDASGARNDLWLQGARRVPGRQGSGVSFSGPGVYGQLDDAYLPAGEGLSVAAWVRPVYPESGYAPIVVIGSGGYDRFEFGLGPDNLYPVISDGQSHSVSALYASGLRALLPPGQWGHIAICAGAQGATTYVSGVPRAHSEYRGKFDFTDRCVRLGIRGGEEYDGDLDEVRIWNRCLSEAEVKALVK